jgi:hypothetical protein
MDEEAPTTAVMYQDDLYFLGNYIMNWMLWGFTWGKTGGCANLGLINLFFFDDNGTLMDTCFMTGLQGALATFYGEVDQFIVPAEEEEEF